MHRWIRNTYVVATVVLVLDLAPLSRTSLAADNDGFALPFLLDESLFVQGRRHAQRADGAYVDLLQLLLKVERVLWISHSF